MENTSLFGSWRRDPCLKVIQRGQRGKNCTKKVAKKMAIWVQERESFFSSTGWEQTPQQGAWSSSGVFLGRTGTKSLAAARAIPRKQAAGGFA